VARINKAELIKRIQLYRDGEQARVEKANADRQKKYEADRAKYEEELKPHLMELRKVLNDTLLGELRVPTYEEIPQHFRDNSWRYILNGPAEPKPEQSKVEYYDTMLAFLAAVTDDTVSETSMAKAGFHEVGRFFAEPDSTYARRYG